MKVAMVTPMSEASAIADVMMQAVPTLLDHWELEVWCPADTTQRACPARVTPFASADSTALTELSTYDLAIWVLGDSPFHSRILPLARALPGLVVLHDASMTNLARTAAIEEGSLDVLVEHVRRSHGAELAQHLSTSTPPGGRQGWLELCAQVPLDDHVLQGSLGAVVHSRWHGRRVDGLTLGEVTVAALPVPSGRASTDATVEAAVARELEALPSTDLLIVTVGQLNANRGVDVLLEAVATDPELRARARVWAVGHAEPEARAEVVRAAERLGIADLVVVTGTVSEPALAAVLARADIAVALRRPVLEGQSASVLTQLLSGTPAVVYDHAHYAELPDDVVVKVDPDGGVEALARGLRVLADDDEGRRARGERGRDHVLSTRSGARYATALLEAAELALAARPRLHLGADLAARLRRLGLHEDAGIVGLATSVAFDLYDLD